MCTKHGPGIMYNYFVSPASEAPYENFNRRLTSGEEASKLYLEEIKEAKYPVCVKNNYFEPNNSGSTRKIRNKTLSDCNLFAIVQSNDVDTLRSILDNCPDKVNTVDEFGWSLLMIACQANCVNIVEELLRKGANTSLRDKAGNSAQSLVIKNKNYILADLLLNHANVKSKNIIKDVKVKLKQVFNCEICNKTFPDREEHLSSTLHNISASRGKKIRSSYTIPQSNKGFQIMLKVGWDKDSGLGLGGSGKLYPIKAVKKNDRKGLGYEKRKIQDTKQDAVKHKTRKVLTNNYHDNRHFEIKFRREFY